MSDRPNYMTEEAHGRYQRAGFVLVLNALFVLHLVAYAVTNAVFLVVFGAFGVWWGLGLIVHALVTFAFGARFATWVDRGTHRRMAGGAGQAEPPE